MDQSTITIDAVTEEAAANLRFTTFKLGSSLPTNLTKKHSHSRSHSRGASISSSASFSASKSSASADMSNFLFPNTLSVVASGQAPPSKRNSHHKRRSSVSTRHESAELMGVSVPDLPPSTSEDNINLGEKDSIRRRALWALEGKPDVAYSKVEIPELSTPVMEKLMFDFPSKPSFPPGPGFGPGINSSMASKRDSFKLLASSSSSKDQLHTLVEEEEEDDDVDKELHAPEASEPVTPSLSITKATPIRPRPANLSLRPLSLTPDTLVATSQESPLTTMTPLTRPGLKSLTLAQSYLPTPPASVDETSRSGAFSSRQTSPSPRPSLNVHCESPLSVAIDDPKPTRRSSISYKPSQNSRSASIGYTGLPTPEMTPTSFERRRSSTSTSSSSNDDEFFPFHQSHARPLSASEQHFLFKSHNALLARITDLEKALSSRRQSSGAFSNAFSSRPVSIASDTSSAAAGTSYGSEPNDEMLSLISDLKAERDELKRDVDGWRNRVADLEKQLGIFVKRVEAERQEAWVAHSRVGLLEIEKSALEKRLEGVDQMITAMESEKGILISGQSFLQNENAIAKKRIAELEQEVEDLKADLDDERRKRIAAECRDLMATPTQALGNQARMGLGFMAENQSSSFGFGLHSIDEQAESSGDHSFSDEDNGLAGYEDENDSDISFQQDIGSSSSFGSASEFPRSLDHLQLDVPASPLTPTYDGSSPGSPIRSRSVSPDAAPAVTSARPTHSTRASLSRNWTFPKPSESAFPSRDSEVDKFFGCLEDDDTSMSEPVSPSAYSYENSKGTFTSGFSYSAGYDDDSPFFLPGGVGFIVEPQQGTRGLTPEGGVGDDEVAAEIDEDSMFGEIKGITITFTPADTVDNVLDEQPPCDISQQSEDVFSEPLTDAPIASTPPTVARGSANHPISPSSIPRRALSKSTTVAEPISPIAASRFPLSSSYSSNAFVTPPTKKGGVMPSFIPQPVSSPSPLRPKTKTALPSTTFIRQPQRQPLTLANNNTKQSVASPANVRIPMNTRSPRSFSDTHEPNPAASTFHWSTSEMKSVDLRTSRLDTTPDDFTPAATHGGHLSSAPTSFSAFVSHTLPSFQSFSSFLPTPWGSRAPPMTDLASPVTFKCRTQSASTPSSGGSVISDDDWKADACAAPVPPKRGFVSKDKQLAKLKARLEHEGTFRTSRAMDVCKKCSDKAVTV